MTPGGKAPALSFSADQQLIAEAEQFLRREAWLLDHGRFDAWLELFTVDASYWVPLEVDQLDALETSSIIYDNLTLLKVRVGQYADGRAHARRPFARTVHQVGNVLVSGAAGNDLEVASTLVLVEYRQERQRVWGANVVHRLRRVSAGLRIAAKRVELVNSESELDGIAFLF